MSTKRRNPLTQSLAADGIQGADASAGQGARGANYSSHEDPRITANTIRYEENENAAAANNGAIRCVGRANGADGFVVRHEYANVALAREPVTWHVAGGELLCLVVAGIRFTFNADCSVVAEIHCAAGSPLCNAARNFLSSCPRAAAYGMCAEVLSEHRRIAVLAVTQDWARFTHLGAVIGHALLTETRWAFPDRVQPCDSCAAQRQIKTPEVRALAERAMAFLRRGLRAGGAS